MTIHIFLALIEDGTGNDRIGTWKTNILTLSQDLQG